MAFIRHGALHPYGERSHQRGGDSYTSGSVKHCTRDQSQANDGHHRGLEVALRPQVENLAHDQPVSITRL